MVKSFETFVQFFYQFFRCQLFSYLGKIDEVWKKYSDLVKTPRFGFAISFELVGNVFGQDVEQEFLVAQFFLLDDFVLFGEGPFAALFGFEATKKQHGEQQEKCRG